MKKLIVLLSVIALCITSCSKKTDNLKIIPKDAGVVLSIDPYSLYKKADVEELQQLKSFQKLKDEFNSEGKEMKEVFNEILKDPRSSGIDVKKNFFFFSFPEGDQVLGAFTAVLDSDSKFESFVTKVFKANDWETDIKKQDGRKELYSREGVVAWDNEKVLVINKYRGISENDLPALIKKLFSLDSKEQISSIEGFTKFLNEQKDINFWLNPTTILKSMEGEREYDRYYKLYRQLFNLQKDSYVYGFLDFGKEKVTLTTHNILNEEYNKLMKKYNIYDVSFNKDILKMYPEKMLFVFGGALNMQNYYQMLKEQFPDLIKEDKIKDVLEKEGLKLENLTNLLGGSFTFAITDFQQETYTGTSFETDEETGLFNPIEVPKERFSPVVLAGIEIKDKTILNKFTEAVPLEKGDGYQKIQIPIVDAELYFNYSGNVLYITNNMNVASQFAKGEVPNNALNSPFSKQVSKDLIYGKWDMNIKHYPQSFINKIQDDSFSNNSQANKAFELWTKYSENIEIRRIDNQTAEIVYNLKGIEKNFLNTLFKAIDQIANDEN